MIRLNSSKRFYINVNVIRKQRKSNKRKEKKKEKENEK